MKRAHSQVAREIADDLDRSRGDWTEGDWRPRLQRWLLALNPPKPRRIRPKDTIRALVKVGAPRLTDKVLDDLCRRLVKHRDGYKCRICGRGDATGSRVQWHHIMRRVSHKTRWLLSNGITLCELHHLWWHDSNNAHLVTEWCAMEFGSTFQEEMRRAAKQKGKVDRFKIHQGLLEECRRLGLDPEEDRK